MKPLKWTCIWWHLIAPVVGVAQVPQDFMRIRVSPEVVSPGVPVVIAGTILPKDTTRANRQYTVVITPPVGSRNGVRPTTRAVLADAQGSFTASFHGTDVVGEYTIAVTTPGIFSADGSFRVVSVAQLIEGYAATMDRLLKSTETEEKWLAGLVPQLPPSPERVQVEQGWAKTRPAIAGMRRADGRFRELLTNLKVLIEFPAGPAPSQAAGERVRKLVSGLDDWRTRAEKNAFDYQVIQQSRDAGELCETIEKLTEGLRLVSLMFNLAAEPWVIAENFVKDLVISRPPSRGTAVGDWGQANAIKNHNVLAYDAAELHTAGHTAIVDFVGLTTRVVFDRYCATMSGPMKATMDVEFTHDKRLWWKYDFKLDGRLILRYAKGKSTTRAVRGEFIGNGHAFSVAWNPGVSPEFLGKTGTMLFHVSVAPGSTPPQFRPEFEGKIVEVLATPKSFFIPVSGEVANDRVTLRLGTARFDFEEDTEATGYYMMLSGLLGFQFDRVSLPYKGAHHVITRATGDGLIVIPVKRTSANEVAERHFARPKETGGSKANYSLSVRICGGGCN